jgi:pyrroline-5-carboxylate reductase
MPVFKSLGFCGGGRVTYLLLRGLQHRKTLPEMVLVHDPDQSHIANIQALSVENIKPVNNNTEAAQADVVFLAVHPPVIETVIGEIKHQLKPTAIIVSLIPMVTIQRLKELLDGFDRIVRMIPNAPSMIGKGYNPVVFSPTLNNQEKAALLKIFENWGESPEVAEEQLEAYAILTGMGPTYFWFQWLELVRLAKEFGLEEDAAHKALNAMLTGAAETLFNSGLPAEKVLDLIPAYPLKKQEDAIRQVFSEKLTSLFQKLTQERR